jgi:uncharacterized protein (UPF0218 family)
MEQLLKFTYMLEPEKIEIELETFWKRYLQILENPNWEDINEARAILYIIGFLYTEQIGPEAIERRLHLLENQMDMSEFLHYIDSDSDRLIDFRNDPLFIKLEKLYRIIKKFKNLEADGRLYLNEDKFIELYNKLAPSEEYKTGRCGRKGLK